MKIGILGSGNVGKSLASGFLKLGYEVKIGTRNPEKLKEWSQKEGKGLSVGSFSEAAGFGEMAVIATMWGGTENAIKMANKNNFSNKIVIDTTNPLKTEKEGEAPTLAVAYPQSAGILVQKWLPDAKVVKAFNTVGSHYMTNPKLQEGTPDLFIAGNNLEAKNKVKEIASALGWKDIHDLGNIEQSHLLEAIAMAWIKHGFNNKDWNHAWKMLKK